MDQLSGTSKACQCNWWQLKLSDYDRILGTTLGSSGGGNEQAIEKDLSQAKELNIATLKHCFVFSLFSHI